MVKSGTPEGAFNWRNITGKTIGLLRYYIEDEDCIQSLTEVVVIIILSYKICML